ncbi:MAG: Nif3-like dinuclear metal center hexameric protein [Clostridia bacterium]|nr:Nif3-like dinuclear metal center hexameric protein [Clostridia bacterium]
MDIIGFSNEVNARIPLSYSAGWDNDGLMCAPDPARTIRRVLCVLDVTEEVIDRAVSGDFDLILSHHPFIFHPIRSLNSAEGEGRMIGKLFRSGIGVISCHTRLDAVPGGVADRLCSLIGLSDIRTVAEGGEGVLRVGILPGTTDISSFCSALKNRLGAPIILYSNHSGKVGTVAVCPGDGKDFVSAAKENGADTYVTGRLSYNSMCDAGRTGINLVEAGHFFTENHITDYLCEIAREICGAYAEKFDSFRIRIIKE